MIHSAVAVPAEFGSRYHLERELGQGAMATVYLARDLLHQREVAIKVMRADLVAILGPERFLREIRIAAQFHHPHILPLLDSGDLDGRLFYVMPVARETLRARLDRERQLPLEDALAIAREVAEALQYAHERDIVHRDIKPENILLDRGHALVADFGIARAADPVGATNLSSSGIAFGTPAYMSPEQASAERTLDGRADIYSLGCVLYEMLAGERVFSGPSAQVIAKRHMYEKVPSLALSRPDLPGWVQGVVEKALAKTAADRYADGAAFRKVLNPQLHLTDGPARAPVGRGALLATLIVALAFVAARWLPTLTKAERPPVGASSVPADTARFLVFPFEHPAGAPADVYEDELLREAFRRWSGLTTVEGFRIREAIARQGPGPVSGSDLRRMAREARAGRYVRGEMFVAKDSVRFHAVLYDAAGGQMIRESSVSSLAGRSTIQAAITRLADQLLLGGDPAGDGSGRGPGTTSLPAFRAVARGKEAIQRWDLAAADSELTRATAADPNFVEASLWLAQTRMWSGSPAASWRSAAERTAAGKSDLSPRDQAVSTALLSFAQGDLPRACAIWSRLATDNLADFAAWYSDGYCLRSDDAVVRDRASPSGWRFRSSYHRALVAYLRAFRILPAIHRSLRSRSYESVRQLLLLSGGRLRAGRAVAPNTGSFSAYPSFQGDSLGFVPYPDREVAAGDPRTVPSSQAAAIQYQRKLFHELTLEWVGAFPRDPDALEALAVSLEMLRDPAGLDTLRRARALAADEPSQRRIASLEVWMRIKLALPDDVSELQTARRLADSLLNGRIGDPDQGPLLAGLAALTGRASLAAQLSQAPAFLAAARVPAALGRSVAGLLAFAALGGPSDSLNAFEERVSSSIDRNLAPGERDDARVEWLGHPASMAFPEHVMQALPGLAGKGDYLIDAQAAWLGRDTARVRAAFDTLRRARRAVLPWDLTIDALYPEASLLAATGDSVGAQAWLDPLLSSLAQTPPQGFANPYRAGTLVRAMILRAKLARTVGDHRSAQRWARAVTVFWSDADPFLRPVVKQMKSLLR